MGPEHPSFRFEMFLSAVAWSAIRPALTHGTLSALAGERVRVRSMLYAGATRLYPSFLALLGTGIVISLGAIAFVVPGIVAACAFWLAVFG